MKDTTENRAALIEELERLRRRVAELEASEAELRRADRTLQTLVASTVGCVGQEFFEGIVDSLCEWLGVDCALIGELVDKDRVRTISIRLDGRHVEPLTYRLPGTPCENVSEKGFCIYPEGVCDLFPQDKILVEMRAEGYAGTPLRDKKGAPIGILCAISRQRLELPPRAQDVFEVIADRASAEIGRKRAEEELRKVNRSLKVLIQCNEALVRARDEASLLNEICRIITETGGYRLAWVGYALHDGAKSVQPVAQAGYEQGYLETVKITWADTPRGRGPTGTAIREGRPVVLNNISADHAYRPWRAEAQRRGYASSIALPLVDDSETIGSLNIYASEPDAFNDEEVSLLNELARDMAYGIVSLRTQAERRRAESMAARFGRILDDSLNEIYIFNAETLRFIQVNNGAVKNLGYSAEEFRDLTPLDIKPEFTRESLLRLLEPLLDGREKRVRFTTVHKRRDGTVYPVEVHVQASTFESTPVFVAIILDITERKRAEEALREREEQIELLLKSTAEAIYGLDLDGNCTFANPACLKLLGYDEIGDILGRNMHELIHHTRPDGSAYPVDECRIYRAFQKGEGTHADDEVLWRKDGKCFPVEYWSYPIRKNGNITGSVVTFIDITERKRAEEELLAKTRKLDLLNKDLHELTMEITRLEDKERKRFARILHDDIGQNLVAIKMAISTCLKEDAPAATKEKLGEVCSVLESTIGAIRGMCSDLYPVSPYGESLIDKRGLVDAATWYVNNVLESAGITGYIDMEGDVEMLPEAYKQCVYRVLQECIQNVVKHSSASRVDVRCSVDGERLRLSVRDNGIGLPSKGRGSRQSSGVGLRLMRERVKSLKGALTIRSQRGKGTEIIAEFPGYRQEDWPEGA